MALFLQRKFSLPVVKVGTTDLGGCPVAHIQLVVNADGQQRTVADQTHELADFGYAETSGRANPKLGVPREVTQWIADWVRDQLGPDDVLWLYLVKPYGALGAVPWERDLQPEINIPLLRLPDALPDPDRCGSVFQVALCATAPAEKGPSTAVQLGPHVARALAEGLRGRLRLHVFADIESHPMLAAELNSVSADEVTIHRPNLDSDSSLTTPARGIQNSWLRWIRQEMQGLTLDAAHFITHGCALGHEGAILTTPSPASTDRRYPQTVQSGELRTFLTKIGALVVGFTRPDGNYSDYALWRLVDELGSMRAGPVLLHDPRTDPAMKTLSQAYAFLSAPEPGRPPADPNIMLYAQPHQVADLDLDQVPPVPVDSELTSSSAVKEHFARTETPQWVAAAERYIEDCEADLIRFEQSKQIRSPTGTEEAYYSGVHNALRKVRAVVDQHAERRL